MAWLVEQAGELVRRRGRQGVRPERGHRVVLDHGLAAEQLRPGALLGAELLQAQLPTVLDPNEHPRGPVAQRGALVEQLQPSGGHQVDEQRELPGVDGEHLADPADASDLEAGERVERWIEGL